MLSVTVAVAGHQDAQLDLRILDRGQFTVQFDDLVFDHPGTNFQIRDIRPGRHLLKVRQVNPSNHHNGGRGHHRGHAKRGRLIFWGYVDIDREMAELAKNQIRFAYASRFMQRSFSKLKSAIRGEPVR